MRKKTDEKPKRRTWINGSPPNYLEYLIDLFKYRHYIIGIPTINPVKGKEMPMNMDEFRLEYPNLVFVKSRSHIENENELRDENFIFDDDTPTLVKNATTVMPLSVTDFPRVLKSITAMEAGVWAVSKCREQKWEISRENIDSCLANLEMDF